MKPCILITGFGAFPHAPVNPTGALVKTLLHLRHPALAGIRRIGHVFSTAYDAVDRDLPALLARHQPDAILMFGLAQRRRHVSVELFARNAITYFADAGGTIPQARLIVENHIRRIKAPTPALHLVRAAQGCGLRAVPSHDAGAYLCNYLYWRAVQASQNSDGPKFASFVHVPMPRNAHARAQLANSAQAMLLALVSALRSRH